MAHQPEQQDNMDGSFGAALKAMNIGRKVRRRGWNGDMWITIQKPGNGSEMTLPYIYLSTVTNDMVPWFATQIDMLAMDWESVS